MNSDRPLPKRQLKLVKWVAFNLLVGGLYLAFFHLCLDIRWPWSMVIGIVIALVITGFCFRFRSQFLNRYEFLFYLSIPLDVAVESLIPVHSGFSFYWCAASFWLVFILYRIYLGIDQRRITRRQSPGTFEKLNTE